MTQTSTISIDFPGGAHGNYLEFVCNRFIANVPVVESSPFNSLGASHKKQYLGVREFVCGHYSHSKLPMPPGPIISIEITPDDLLALQCISLLRAGDYDIDPDQLEVNTYNKLNNVDYQWVLDNLYQQYFQNQIVESYNAMADASWPRITKDQQYFELPQTIRDECEQVHGLELHTFDSDHPNCPRYILREFFKFGFLNPSGHGFIAHQPQKYYTHDNVYKFPYASFYDMDKFANSIGNLAQWLGRPFTVTGEFVNLHQEFLKRQVYKNIKTQTDNLFEKILSGEQFSLPTINVIQEAYIDAKIEMLTRRPVPLNQTGWFSTSRQIQDLL